MKRGYDIEFFKLHQEKANLEKKFRDGLKLIQFNQGKEQILAFKNGQAFVRM